MSRRPLAILAALAASGSGTQSSPWNSTASVSTPTFQRGGRILFARGGRGTGVSTGNARSGSRGVAMPGGSSAGAEQTVTGLSPDTQYRLQGSAKTAVAGQRVRIGVKDFGGAQTRTCAGTASHPSGPVTSTTGPSTTSAIACFGNPPGDSGTGDGDNLALEPTPAAHHHGAFQNAGTGSRLDIGGDDQSAGTTGEVRARIGGATQLITRTAGGALQVRGGSATLCPDVSGGAAAAGSAVVIDSRAGSTAQR